MTLYQGESIDIMIRALTDEGAPLDVSRAEISVVFIDSDFEVAVVASTMENPEAVAIERMGDSTLKFKLQPSITATLCGLYSLEIKLSIDEHTLIERIKGIKIKESVIGQIEQL